MAAPPGAWGRVQMADARGPAGSDSTSDTSTRESRHAYWRANLRVMSILLTVWFGVSYGLGIVFVEPLNRFHVGGFPLGFWFAQQGAIYVFVVLIAIYAVAMDRIDRRYEDDASPKGAQRGAAERSSHGMDP